MLREGTLEDVPRVAAMRQRAWPDGIVTADGMSHFLRSIPEHAGLRLFADEQDGEIVGWAHAGRAWWDSDTSQGIVAIAVDPAHRGKGIGSGLAEAADAHLGALGIRTTRSESLDEPAARALATSRGFEEIGSSSVSAVDPRTVEPLPVPEDVTIVPFAEIDDPEPIWALDLRVSRDIPNSETFDALSLEQWVSQYWRTPLVDDDASLAAVVDGTIVAVTFIRVDRPSGRAQNALAGTLPPYRGRGLATMLKSHSLHRAAALGATIALTDNDEANAPMLAVNSRLGYRPFARRLTWRRSPPTSAP